MVIQCTHCQARFKLADDKIKPEGTKVRCTKCREIFTVFPEASAQPPSPPAAAAPPPPVSVALPSAAAEEFSFDLGDILAAQPPAVTQAPAAAPAPVGTPEISFESEPTSQIQLQDTPTSSDEGIAFSFAADDSAALSFDEATGASIAIGSPSATGSGEVNAEFDDDAAFSFDDAAAPVFAVAQPAADTPPDAFSFPDTSDTAAVSFDSFDTAAAIDTAAATITPPPAATDEFSFDTASGEEFEAFSFDDKSTPEPAPASVEFSFDQGDAATDFSWDEPPVISAQEAQPAAVPSNSPRQEEPKDLDFNDIFFGSESEKKAAAAPAVATEQKTPETPRQPAPAIPAVMDTPSPRPAAPPPPRPTTHGVKRQGHARPQTRSSSPVGGFLKVLLVLLVVAGGVFGFLKRDVLQMQFTALVDRYIDRLAPGEATGQIDLVDLSGSIVENQQVGQLYVIRGVATNAYPAPRSSIRVKAVLFDKQGRVLQEATAYCGNILNDAKLARASFAAIKENMANELGDSLTNLNIAPGKSIPFTVVFNIAPGDIAEFTVEVVDSKPGAN